MIILRIFIARIPDTWDPSTIWYLAAAETLIEVFLISVITYQIRTIL